MKKTVEYEGSLKTSMGVGGCIGGIIAGLFCPPLLIPLAIAGAVAGNKLGEQAIKEEFQNIGENDAEDIAFSWRNNRFENENKITVTHGDSFMKRVSTFELSEEEKSNLPSTDYESTLNPYKPNKRPLFLPTSYLSEETLKEHVDDYIKRYIKDRPKYPLFDLDNTSNSDE